LLALAKMDAGWVKRWLETASTMALKPFTKWAVACDLIETANARTVRANGQARRGDVRKTAALERWPQVRV
jgi:hypothetical protein